MDMITKFTNNFTTGNCNQLWSTNSYQWELAK